MNDDPTHPAPLRLAEVTCIRPVPDGTPTLAGLTDDSRAVAAGMLYVARGPWRDTSASYLDAAIQQGAAVVLLPEAAGRVETPSHVGVYTAPQVDQILAGRVADRFYDHPADRLRLLGVTGTNGKTTIAMLAQHLLGASGVKAGLLGTVWTDVGNPAGPAPAELTTPGAIELRKHLADMVRHGCTAAVMEVSSHALEQGRVAGLAFDAAVFTNLTQDHLDYHGDMDAYADAKATLFAQLKPTGWAVINGDDPAGPRMAERVPPGRVLWTHVRDTAHADETERHQPGHCVAVAEELAASGTRARFDGPWGSAVATLPMVGRHNVSNALQAAAAAHCLARQTSRDLRQRLEASPPVPGRLEPVRRQDGTGPVVLVDYAHTPDALENAGTAVRAVTPRDAQLFVVYGCGGDRDRTKRPRMTAAALRFADRAFLTSDNPRSEDPQTIVDDAQRGVPDLDRARLRVQVDRAQAIAEAIRDAGPGDTVLIAGKGHEDYQVVADPPGQFGGATRKLHFDDREHAEAALQAWTPAAPSDAVPC